MSEPCGGPPTLFRDVGSRNFRHPPFGKIRRGLILPAALAAAFPNWQFCRVAAETPKIEFTPTTIVLVFLAGILLTLIEIEAMEYSWEKLGIPHRWFFGLLVGSLFGSAINLPLTRLGGKSEDHTLLAINLGGALLPAALAIYLLINRPETTVPAVIGAAIVTGLSFLVAQPMKGVGVAMPLFVAPLAAAAAGMVLAPDSPAVVAYVAGTLGTLIGADLLNLGRMRSIGAPIVSIGGAGTFDGVFLSGLLAVLLS